MGEGINFISEFIIPILLFGVMFYMNNVNSSINKLRETMDTQNKYLLDMLLNHMGDKSVHK